MEWAKMRRFKQQVAEADCIAVLKTETRGVLAVNGENGYPYPVPINFYYSEAERTIYFHGAKQGEKLARIREDPRAAFCTYNQGFLREGEWAYNVTSVIVRGRVSILDDLARSEEICRKLGRKYYPSKEAVEAEIHKAFSRAYVFALTVESMTGKLVNES